MRRDRHSEHEPLVVRSADAAAVLAHPKKRRILFAFVDREHSLAEVSATTGVPLNLLHYHVLRMVRAGLLDRRGKRTRAGRPVQLYRAVASGFVVPATLMRGKPDEALHQELRRILERRHADAYLFARERNGRVRMSRVGAEDSGELWRVMRLDRASARELADDLRRLIASYEERLSTRKAGKPHLVHIAIVGRERSSNE